MICDEIKKRFIRLSRGQRKVAQFIIDNQNIIATHTAYEVGKLIGVSESTVIRFCYAMELSGYTELQKKIKENLLGNESNQDDNDHPLLKKKRGHLLSDVMNRDIKSILNTIHIIDNIEFERAAKLIHESPSLYVLGFRQSAPSAIFLTSTLNYYNKPVKQIQQDNESIIQQISSMNQESLVIIIALDSVIEDVMAVAKLAKNKRAKIIAITNTNESVDQDKIDILFTVGTQKQTSTETITAAHSLIHALVEGMVAQNKNEYTTNKKNNTQYKGDLDFLDTANMI